MAIERLLLVSGAIGAGKSSVAAELQNKQGFRGISSGAYLRLTGSVSSREDLQNFGDQLDRETDFKWLIDEVAWPTIEGSYDTTRWLLDAVRKQRQVEHFRSRFGSVVRHVHLFAPEKVLSSRYCNRHSADLSSYERAIDHPNERAARALINISDAHYDSSKLTVNEIAAAIMQDMGIK